MKTKVHPKTPVFEYSKITKYLYIGSNQCCQAHFNQKLIKKGIVADISLEENKIDHPFGVKFYSWLPTKNHASPTQKQLILGARTIKDLVDNKMPVYVHCKNGHGRAPTLVAAYLLLSGMNLAKARELLKKKRPSIHLDKSQINALKLFEKRLK